MNNSIYAILTTVVLTASSVVFAQEAVQEDVGSRAYAILISVIETPDTRSSKIQNPVQMPVLKQAFTEEEQAQAVGDKQKIAQAMIIAQRIQQNKLINNAIMDKYRKDYERQELIIKKAQGTPYGRTLSMCRDWLASAFTDYEVFTVISRADDGEAFLEANNSEKDPLDLKNATFFIKAALADPHTSERSWTTSGGNNVTKHTYTQTITVQLQDMKNQIVFSKDYEMEESWGSSDVGVSSGMDDRMGKVIRKAFKAAAKDIAGKYTRDVKIKIQGPKGDKDFDADDAEVTIDGEDVDVDDEINLTLGEHKIVVDMDGYTQKTKPEQVIKGKTSVVKIKMAPEMDDDGDDDEDDEE